MMRKATVNQGLPRSRPYYYRRDHEAVNTRNANERISSENYRNTPPEYSSRGIRHYQRTLQHHFRGRRTPNHYGVKVKPRQSARNQGSGNQQYSSQRYHRSQQGYRPNRQKGGKNKMDVAEQSVSQEKEVEKVTEKVIVEKIVEKETEIEVIVDEPGEKTPLRSSSRKAKSVSPETKTVSTSRDASSPEKKLLKRSPRLKPESKAVEESKNQPDVVENGSEQASTDHGPEDSRPVPPMKTLQVRLSDVALKLAAQKSNQDTEEILDVSNTSCSSFVSLPSGSNVPEENDKGKSKEKASPMPSPKRGKTASKESVSNLPEVEVLVSPSTSSQTHDQSPRGDLPSLGRNLRSISARRPLRDSSPYVSPSTSWRSFPVSSPSPAVSPKKHPSRKPESPEKARKVEVEPEFLDTSTEEVAFVDSCTSITEVKANNSSYKKRKDRSSEEDFDVKKLKARHPEEENAPSNSSFLSLVSSPFFLFKRAKKDSKENSALIQELVDDDLEIASDPLETFDEKVLKEDSEVEVVELDDENLHIDSAGKEDPPLVVPEQGSAIRRWCRIM